VARLMLFLGLTLYLLLGVIASNACRSFASYAMSLTAWPIVLLALGLRGRFELIRFAD
jgi:hypothetical protein